MFYLFHGEDTHSQQETLDKLKAKLGDPAMLDLNTTRFEGAVTLSQLRHACDAIPFLAKARLTIVQDLFKSKPSTDFLKELADYLPTLPDTTRLVFMESKGISAKHRIFKLANEAENGYVKAFERPEGRTLSRWVQNRVTEYGGTISPHAIQLLITDIGNDLQILDNEINKLTLYKHGATIESQDVELLCPYVAEANIFDLVDAIGNRNAKKAAILLQQKFNEGVEPFYLFSMIIRQFRLLIQVKELADDGLKPPAISKEIRQHSYVVGKLFQQGRGFSLTQLESIYRHLLAIDVDVKTGKNDINTALGLLVATLTV